MEELDLDAIKDDLADALCKDIIPDTSCTVEMEVQGGSTVLNVTASAPTPEDGDTSITQNWQAFYHSNPDTLGGASVRSISDGIDHTTITDQPLAQSSADSTSFPIGAIVGGVVGGVVCLVYTLLLF